MRIKDQKSIAQLSSSPKAGLSLLDLQKLLQSLPKLDSNDVVQLNNDLNKVRRKGKLPDCLWEKQQTSV